MIISADLGSSSIYSNEVQKILKYLSLALKTVVEEVSLRVALMQGLVDPKCSMKINISKNIRMTRKGIRLIFLNFYIKKVINYESSKTAKLFTTDDMMTYTQKSLLFSLLVFRI